jgi:hypothetical protein
MGGIYDFHPEHYKSNFNTNQRVVSTHNKKIGFYQSGNKFVDYELIVKNDNLYGTKKDLNKLYHFSYK